MLSVRRGAVVPRFARGAGFPRLMSTTASAGSVNPVHFPVGESDFRAIRRDGQFFADNSRHIATLEDFGKHLIFTRPPRWGKSLFVDMVGAYHDKNTTEEEFIELFGGLDICTREAGPAPLARAFHVLPLDIGVSVEDPDRIEQNMFDEINANIGDCALRYDLAHVNIVNNNGNASLVSLAHAVRRKAGLLYVTVDEYDRFANKLMFEHPELYARIVIGESGQPSSSPLRSFLETVKKIKPSRTLVTGITSIALADASGANSFTSVSLLPSLGSICGLNEAHLRAGLAKLQLSAAQTESAVELMRAFFDGYYYPGVPDDQPLFNSQQCLFFLKQLAEGNFLHLLDHDKWKKMDPTTLVATVQDRNTKLSANALNLLLKSPLSQTDVVALATTSKRCVLSSLDSTYHLKEMMMPLSGDDSASVLNRSRAFMFSHGIVSLAAGSREGEGFLTVPNKIARFNYISTLKNNLQLRDHDLGQLFLADATQDTVQEFLQNIVDKIETPVDAEATFQVSLEAWLKALQLAAPRYQVVAEGPTLRGHNQGFMDLLFVDAQENAAVVLELETAQLNFLCNKGKTKLFGKGVSRKTRPLFEETIQNFTEEELLALRKKEKFTSAPAVYPTLLECLDRKLIQVSEYRAGLRQEGFPAAVQGMSVGECRISAFAAFHVGGRIIVREAEDEPGQPVAGPTAN